MELTETYASCPSILLFYFFWGGGGGWKTLNFALSIFTKQRNVKIECPVMN